MRLLILTALSISAWAQPAPQQTQPPIVVQVQMPPTPHRDFLGYLQSLGPLIAACVAVGVALMQRHLQKQQQKQNLYDRRWNVYSQLMSQIQEAIDWGEEYDEQQFQDEMKAVSDTLNLKEDAQFLFGPEVMVVIIDVTQKQLTAVRSQLQIEGCKEAHSECQEELFLTSEFIKIQAVQARNTVELRRLRSKSRDAFQPYLQLHNWENPMKRLATKANNWMASYDQIFDSRYDSESPHRHDDH